MMSMSDQIRSMRVVIKEHEHLLDVKDGEINNLVNENEKAHKLIKEQEKLLNEKDGKMNKLVLDSDKSIKEQEHLLDEKNGEINKLKKELKELESKLEAQNKQTASTIKSQIKISANNTFSAVLNDDKIDIIGEYFTKCCQLVKRNDCLMTLEQKETDEVFLHLESKGTTYNFDTAWVEILSLVERVRSRTAEKQQETVTEQEEKKRIDYQSIENKLGTLRSEADAQFTSIRTEMVLIRDLLSKNQTISLQGSHTSNNVSSSNQENVHLLCLWYGFIYMSTEQIDFERWSKEIILIIDNFKANGNKEQMYAEFAVLPEVIKLFSRDYIFRFTDVLFDCKLDKSKKVHLLKYKP